MKIKVLFTLILLILGGQIVIGLYGKNTVSRHFSRKGAGLKVFSQLSSVYPVAQDVGLNETDNIIIQNIGDQPLQIFLSYKLYPQELSGKIYLVFPSNGFYLDAGSLVSVPVNIIVESGASVGLYNVSIIVEGQTSAGGGNPIVLKSIVNTIILVGQYSYRLIVRLRQPDGTPTMGLIKVSYYYQGSYLPLYQVKASNYTFYVIEGRYLVEAYLGDMKRASQEVEIYQDTVVSLTYSSIYVERFSILFEPRTPNDSLIFRFTVKNDDPLIYRKTIVVTASLYNESGIVVNNRTMASLTIRSLMVKDVLGYIRPTTHWINGTYRLSIFLYSKSKILYNYTTTMNIVVISPVNVKFIQQIPFHYLLLLTLLGVLFGFFGAKFALLRARGKILPKVVGLLYGRDYVAYTPYGGVFEDPEFISGDWNKALYGFRILAKRYLKKRERERAPKFITITLNAEKWLFIPVTQEIFAFICIHSSINEFDLLDKIEKLVNYFKIKVSREGIHSLLINPEGSLADIDKLIKKLFV